MPGRADQDHDQAGAHQALALPPLVEAGLHPGAGRPGETTAVTTSTGHAVLWCRTVVTVRVT